MIRRQPPICQALRNLLPAALFLLCLIPVIAACSQADPPPPTPTQDPVILAGRQVFITHCGACHSSNPGTVIVGPSLAGIATAGGDRIDGLDARTYVYSSIMQPSDYVVGGYEDLMPKDLAKKLTGEELDNVVAYVLSLE